MQDSKKKDNIIVRLSFELAVTTIEFCHLLDEERKWSLSNQIMRAALSIGANIKEAQNAESRNDFIHQMKIPAKEAENRSFILKCVSLLKGYLIPVNCLTNSICVPAS